MSTIILPAHFDGGRICLDEPFELEPDAKLLVTILPKQPADDVHEHWLRLSQEGLERAYGDDEVEYSLDLIKEPNLEYEGRNLAATP